MAGWGELAWKSERLGGIGVTSPAPLQVNTGRDVLPEGGGEGGSVRWTMDKDSFCGLHEAGDEKSTAPKGLMMT